MRVVGFGDSLTSLYSQIQNVYNMRSRKLLFDKLSFHFILLGISILYITNSFSKEKIIYLGSGREV